MVKTINAIDQHVGHRVRSRRQSLRLTQLQLGNAVGVCFQQIANYETGCNRISSSRLGQIAKALGVPPSFFFEPDGADVSEQAEKTAAILLATAEGEALIESFRRIRCPRMRRAVIGIIQQLADAGMEVPASE